MLLLDTEYGGEQAVLVVRSGDVTSLKVSGSRPATAELNGKARFKIEAADDGSTLLGWSNGTFAATAVDKEPSPDGFGIVVKDANGVVVGEVPIATLKRGEVVHPDEVVAFVHSPSRRCTGSAVGG